MEEALSSPITKPGIVLNVNLPLLLPFSDSSAGRNKRADVTMLTDYPLAIDARSRIPFWMTSRWQRRR